MGREVKRVPLKYNYILNEKWKGYTIENAGINLKNFPYTSCQECENENCEKDDFCMEENTPYCIYYNSKWRNQWFEEVPSGDAWQLWETTTEGSPLTPPFQYVNQLAEYCFENKISYFGSSSFQSKEEWLNYFKYELEQENKEINKRRYKKLNRILEK